ncbi:MAG TPA: hypothetical protein DCW90_22570 [Lachnospiraceae bacterium]|nr:radical SAM protein [uncultured Lachnoclostridium sp.]HAU88155.1 hypothetical protein [Lachnospiraceae bacterium]
MITNNIEYIPENCLLELGFKCNLNCKHCGSSLNGYKEVRKGRTLTKNEVFQFIDELKSLGGKRLGLVGGEPLLCEYWEEVARYASEREFQLSMISNGMLIDDNTAKRIKEAGITLVALSLDGDREFHNELRGNEKAYDKVIGAISLLKKQNVQVNIITTIMNDNLKLLPAVEKILGKEKIGFWQLQLGIPMGKLKENKEKVIKPNQLKEIESFILSAKERKLVEITVADSIGYCSKSELSLRNNVSTDGNRFFYGCMAGIRGVSMESNGNIKGCLSLQDDTFIEGNYLESSLSEIWNSKNAFSYNRKFNVEKLEENCKGCKYGEVCRAGCTTLAFNTSGSVNMNEYCLHQLEEKEQ